MGRECLGLKEGAAIWPSELLTEVVLNHRLVLVGPCLYETGGLLQAVSASLCLSSRGFCPKHSLTAYSSLPHRPIPSDPLPLHTLANMAVVR